MNTKIKNTFLGFLLWAFLFGLVSCREKIDIPLKGTYRSLVVDARINLDTTPYPVILTYSADYYNPQVDSVSGARVSVFDGENEYVYTESENRKGLYLSPQGLRGVEGKTYTLRISDVDADGDGENETYEATATMPYIAQQIDSIKAVYGPGVPPFFMPDPKVLGWNILFYAQDPPSKEYYAFSIAVNGKGANRIFDLVQIPDDFTQGLYINGICFYFFPDDDKDKALKPGDTVRMEARSISKQYDTYISDVKEAVSSSLPVFGGNPANIRGNMSNGAYGFFAVYANRYASTIVGRP